MQFVFIAIIVKKNLEKENNVTVNKRILTHTKLIAERRIIQKHSLFQIKSPGACRVSAVSAIGSIVCVYGR